MLEIPLVSDVCALMARVFNVAVSSGELLTSFTIVDVMVPSPEVADLPSDVALLS